MHKRKDYPGRFLFVVGGYSRQYCEGTLLSRFNAANDAFDGGRGKGGRTEEGEMWGPCIHDYVSCWQQENGIRCSLNASPGPHEARSEDWQASTVLASTGGHCVYAPPNNNTGHHHK
jgi:hypothetical protein